MLRGAERLLSERKVGIVICEVASGFANAGETARLLEAHGYRSQSVTAEDIAFYA